MFGSTHCGIQTLYRWKALIRKEFSIQLFMKMKIGLVPAIESSGLPLSEAGDIPDRAEKISNRRKRLPARMFHSENPPTNLSRNDN